MSSARPDASRPGAVQDSTGGRRERRPRGARPRPAGYRRGCGVVRPGL